MTMSAAACRRPSATRQIAQTLATSEEVVEFATRSHCLRRGQLNCCQHHCCWSRLRHHSHRRRVRRHPRAKMSQRARDTTRTLSSHRRCPLPENQTAWSAHCFLESECKPERYAAAAAAAAAVLLVVVPGASRNRTPNARRILVVGSSRAADSPASRTTAACCR